MRVALFTTCFNDTLYPAIGEPLPVVVVQERDHPDRRCRLPGEGGWRVFV